MGSKLCASGVTVPWENGKDTLGYCSPNQNLFKGHKRRRVGLTTRIGYKLGEVQ